MKKIFITGIAGFIGFHLALQLKKRGDAVTGCDNFNDYYDPALKKDRARVLKENGIDILHADICKPETIDDAVRGSTHFVHLAAQAGVRHSIENPGIYVETNLNGFVQVLELCKRHAGIKLIYASSSSVYGQNKKIPFSEDDLTEAPASFYGATKKSNEIIANAYHHLFGIPVTGLRYFTVYGPWGRPDMAYYSFTKKILEGQPIPIYNEGKMKRDFTYIGDIVDGTIAAIDLGAPCEIFNLGNNRCEDLLDFIAIIEEHTGKSAIKQFLPMQPGDVHITFADITKSQSQLNFKPKTSLQEGLKHFVEWYKEHQKLFRS